MWNLRIDASRIDWVDLPVDALGIAGDIGFATGHPVGYGVWMVSTVAELVTTGKVWDDLDQGDPTGVVLQIGEGLLRASRLRPVSGFISNIVGIGTNLASASYVDIVPDLLIGSPQWPQQ